MRRLQDRGVAVGSAYADFSERLAKDEPDLLDFVEVPFELLVNSPDVAAIGERLPIVLHCASLSLAGNVATDPRLIERLKDLIQATGTPWLGEHLAFVTAGEPSDAEDGHPAFYSAEPLDNIDEPSGSGRFNVGYTVSPQYSEEVLDRVSRSVIARENELKVPILLENSPIYFATPGSTMSQAQFVTAYAARNQGAGLLLDLAHLICTCRNMDLCPTATLDSLPLENVREVHVSGVSEVAGSAWDDHTLPVPESVFTLLARVLGRVTPRAITIEHNWDAGFSLPILRAEVARIRDMVACNTLLPS